MNSVESIAPPKCLSVSMTNNNNNNNNLPKVSLRHLVSESGQPRMRWVPPS